MIKILSSKNPKPNIMMIITLVYKKQAPDLNLIPTLSYPGCQLQGQGCQDKSMHFPE